MEDWLVDYIVKCIEWVSKHGYKLLNRYSYIPKKNNWICNWWKVDWDRSDDGTTLLNKDMAYKFFEQANKLL